MPEIHSQISNDFKTIFGQELNLKGFHIYVDNETYRQSATGLILNETFVNHEDVKIRVECLIDQQRIWIKVKHKPEFSEFTDIFN